MRCAGPVIGVYDEDDAAVLDQPEIVGHKKRAGCGYDVSGLVADAPEDGEEYEIECPKCGNVITVRRTPALEA